MRWEKEGVGFLATVPSLCLFMQCRSPTNFGPHSRHPFSRVHPCHLEGPTDLSTSPDSVLYQGGLGKKQLCMCLGFLTYQSEMENPGLP